MTEEKTTAQPNIYQRIQKTRMQLTELNLKKTGENKFSHYNYYELGDFLPSLNKLMSENGIMTRFVLQKDKAVLEVFNTDAPDVDKIVFYMPVAPSEVKGASAIQQLGSQVTYLRRYLLMTAFEIAETDTVDSEEKKEIKALESSFIKKINDAKDIKELSKVGKEIGEKIKPESAEALRLEYGRRKKEIEDAETEKMNDDFDKTQKAK